MQPDLPLSMSIEIRQATSSRQRSANEQQAEEVQLHAGTRSDSACGSPSQSSTKGDIEAVGGSGSQAAAGNHRLGAFHPSPPQLLAAPQPTSADESTSLLAVPSAHTDNGLEEGFFRAPEMSQAASHGQDDAAQQAGPDPTGSHDFRYSPLGLCKNELITVATTIMQLLAYSHPVQGAVSKALSQYCKPAVLPDQGCI